MRQQVGAGGMGTVYLATDQRFDSPVAIKETLFTDDDLKRAFEREAQLLNRMRHPALPRVIDYFAEGDHQFLVMEYIAGADLSAILKQTGAFPVADVLRWADELLGALEYLHTQKPPVIHRDIKPQNLKLTQNGEIVLLDFGLAKGKTGDTSRLSGTNSVFGYSRAYAPLEQIQGTGTDFRSDLYSLAATLYHLLTGKPPADALTRATAYVNRETDPLLPVNQLNPKVPLAVAAVLTEALELNHGLRIQSATKMREALGKAGSANEIAVQPPRQDDHEITTVSSKNSANKRFVPLVATSIEPPVEQTAASTNNLPEDQPVRKNGNQILIQPTANIIEPAAQTNGVAHNFERAATDSPETSWKSLVGIAATIVILGGGALAWYATMSQPTASRENVLPTTTNQPVNRQPETRAETQRNAVTNSSGSASSTNSAAATYSSINSNAAAQKSANAAQTNQSRRTEVADKSNSSQPPTTSETVVVEEPQIETVVEEEPQPRIKPSPIIVKSAPPTNNPRRKNSDKDNENDDEPNDEPPAAKPRATPTPKPTSDDEAPPAAENLERPQQKLIESRQRLARENRLQKLPIILGAPPRR